ncbi:hypothetical protein [Aurantivibrio plasticivorans]
MKLLNFRAVLSLLSLLCLIGCGGGSSGSQSSQPVVNPPATRSFSMGFTPWLYEASVTAQDLTYTRLAAHGDIVKHHLLGGVPWQQALDQTPYHPNLEAEVQNRIARTSSSTDVFLAIDSLNSERSGLALDRGEFDNMPLQGEWATRSWSSPEVIDAYINYASDMIDRFQPRYFEYGTEISELLLNDFSSYTEYLIFAEAVYGRLKATYPDLNIMVSVALKTPGGSEMQLIEDNIAAVLEFSDVVGLSVYPYVFFSHSDRGNPENLPANWLTQANEFSGGKPIAISETGWIGESLEITDFNYSAESNEGYQNGYLSLLLADANNLNASIVIWWATTDYDTLWVDTLAQDPLAKIWKDIGLYDENQLSRLALGTWDDWLAREVD